MTSYSRMSGSQQVTTPSWLSCDLDLSGIFLLVKNSPQSVAVHTGEGASTVNGAEAGVFRETLCSLRDPVGAGNMMPGSSAVSQSSLNIWKSSAHIPLEPNLKGFENYFASV